MVVAVPAEGVARNQRVFGEVNGRIAELIGSLLPGAHRRRGSSIRGARLGSE
jgi:hypothetical protein